MGVNCHTIFWVDIALLEKVLSLVLYRVADPGKNEAANMF